MIESIKKQYPAYYAIIAVLLTSLIFFFILSKQEKRILAQISSGELPMITPKIVAKNTAGSNTTTSTPLSENNGAPLPTNTNTNANVANSNEKTIVRSNGNGYTHPLLLVETVKPAESFTSLDLSLGQIIEENKNNGKVQSASVYIMDLDNDKWTDVNNKEGYYPGSLMKLAVFMCYLKKSEEHPEILSKTLKLESNTSVPSQTYKDQQIIPNVPYKVSDLFYPMIVRSDNFATLLLNRELDINELNTLFMTLGIRKMDMQNIKYTITAGDYSKFMRVLYNSTYLNAKNSQYALSMLTNSTFNRGLTRDLPKTVVVAHKFGENVSGDVRQLHESGIVYTGAHTYLITVMTKGNKVTDLADVICNISNKAYQYFTL